MKYLLPILFILLASCGKEEERCTMLCYIESYDSKSHYNGDSDEYWELKFTVEYDFPCDSEQIESYDYDRITDHVNNVGDTLWQYRSYSYCVEL